MSDPTPPPTNGVAPADARPHARWAAWKVILAYVVLGALAAAAIWYIDRRAHRPTGGTEPPLAPASFQS